MARSRTVGLAHRARIEAPGSGYELCAVSVDPHDAALAVWTRRDDARHRVVRYAPGPGQAWDVPAGPAPDFAQALPGGRLLVAAGWSRDLPDPGRQALVLGPEGAPEAYGELGDDVRHVLAGTDGAVWAGYGDAGVYGAAEGDPRDRVSAHGLARFDGRLRTSWAFPGDETDPIDDCYALTLTGGTAWAYYYSAFPIVRIADGRVTAWETGIEGAHALLVSPADGRAGLVGDYDHPSAATVGDLAEGAFRPRATARLTLDGRDLAPEDAQVVTRGPTLHAFRGPDWYVTGLDAIA